MCWKRPVEEVILINLHFASRRISALISSHLKCKRSQEPVQCVGVWQVGHYGCEYWVHRVLTHRVQVMWCNGRVYSPRTWHLTTIISSLLSTNGPHLCLEWISSEAIICIFTIKKLPSFLRASLCYCRRLSSSVRVFETFIAGHSWGSVNTGGKLSQCNKGRKERFIPRNINSKQCSS